MKLLQAAAFAALSVGLLGPAEAQPWRYVDKSGAVHYTSNPYDLPIKEQRKALKQLEAQRKRRKAAKIAREAAKAQAKASAALAPEGVPPPVAQPVILDADPKAKPDPKAAWKKRVAEARRTADAARSAAKAAGEAADTASRRAIITPSGPNFAAHATARKVKEDKKKALLEAEAALQRLQREEPR